MTVEYLSLRPANVAVTPGPTYRKVRFLYEGGEGRIIDGGLVLAALPGPLVQSADQVWTIDGDGMSWTVTRGSGCSNCGGG